MLMQFLNELCTLYFPRNLALDEGGWHILLRCIYGTMDAGMLWEDTYAQRLIELGFQR